MEQNIQEQQLKEQQLQAKREERRRRRHKSQMTAYITLAVFAVVVLTGLAVGISRFTKTFHEKEEKQQDKLDAMLATEETLQLPDEPGEPVAELTDEQKLDQIVNAGIEVMPLEDKVAGLFIVTPEAITGVSTAIQAGDGTRDALAKYAVGGIVYFKKNIQSKDQITQMIENTQLYTKYPLFIAVDEEGGSVSRVAEAGLGSKISAAQTIGQTGNADNAYQAGTTIGTYLTELGFNLDFAPVADISSAENNVLQDRSYGSDATAVASYVISMMQGLQEQKVTACLKHFPGIGSSAQDTHDGMAMTDRSAEDFKENEFKVFQSGIDNGAKMIMVGHLSVPSLTGDNTPCSLSEKVVTDILRKEMDFKGVIISDALNMSAITEYLEPEQAAIMALRAGCDMILMPEDFERAYNGVLQAVKDGTISEERINDSLRRIYRIKYADKIAQ